MSKADHDGKHVDYYPRGIPRPIRSRARCVRWVSHTMASPVPIEGVIFDLDGTLIDYEGASHTALSRPLERRGKSFSWELHATIVGTKPEDWSRNIIAAHGLADELPPAQYAAEYFEEVAGLYADIPAWPGTLQLLASLSAAGFPMAIATSSPRQSFEKKMMHHVGILTKMVRCSKLAASRLAVH